MSTLADFTDPDLILPELRSTDAAEAVAELAHALELAGRVADWRVLCAAAMQREALSSTACAPAWALPHARMTGLTDLTFALGRAREPLNWFGATQPVRVVFLVAVPESAAATYLALVASLARLSQEPTAVQQLLRLPDRQSLFRLLEQFKLRSPAPRRLALTR